MANDTDQFSTRSTGSTSGLQRLAMISKQARMVLSAYRKDDFSDPEGFIAQLGVVLEGYTDAVIRAVTDPRTGIQRRLKWPPSIAEMVEACDDEAARLETIGRYRNLSTSRFESLPTDDRPGRRANVFVHAAAPQYAKMVETAQTADSADWKLDPDGRPGIWIAYNFLYSMRGSESFKQMPLPATE